MTDYRGCGPDCTENQNPDMDCECNDVMQFMSTSTPPDPFIESIKRIKLEPGEILAINVQSDWNATMFQAERFKERFQREFPNNRVIITFADSVEYTAIKENTDAQA